jgi:hypothetical protein
MNIKTRESSANGPDSIILFSVVQRIHPQGRYICGGVSDSSINAFRDNTKISDKRRESNPSFRPFVNLKALMAPRSFRKCHKSFLIVH